MWGWRCPKHMKWNLDECSSLPPFPHFLWQHKSSQKAALGTMPQHVSCRPFQQCTYSFSLPCVFCFWFSQLFGCSMANLAHLFHTPPPPLPPIHPPKLGTAKSHGLLRNSICYIPTMWHSIFFLNQGEERKYYYNNNNKMLCEMWPLWYGKEDVGVMSTIARWTKK